MSTSVNEKEKQRKHALDYLAVILSVVAVVISVISFRKSSLSSEDTAYIAAIQSAYSGYNDLQEKQIEHWQLSHLFAMPNDYKDVKANVIQTLVDLDPAKKAEFRLKEQALALFVFDEYEKTFYQWSHVKEAGDEKRAVFFEGMLSYYTDLLLRNPRLLYFWPKLKEGYLQKVRDNYDAKVLNNPQNPLQYEQDAHGPLDEDSLSPVETNNSLNPTAR